MKQVVTLRDIAFSTGVSKSTVSRALSGNCSNIKKETQQMIQDVAKQMGYKQNKTAINFRDKRTRTIGVVVPELITSFYVKFVDFVQSIVEAKGYQVIFAICNEDSTIEKEKLQMMLENQVEGILISACHNTKNISLYKELIEEGIPLVFFDRMVDGISTPKVKMDDYYKSFFLVEHLIRSGRKNIVHLAGPSYMQSARERTRAYKDAMEKFNLPVNPNFIIDSGINFEDGENSMEMFIKQNIPFDGVFCFTEMCALGVQSFLQKHHYSIPKDVAICCFSGTALSTYVHPKLTVVEQPVELMAEKSIELLLEKLEDSDVPDREIVLEATIIVRESTE